MNKIEGFIHHLECPSVNGIIFSDRTIQLFEVEISWERPTEFKLQTSSTTSIDDLEKTGELYWSSCAILDEFIDETGSIKAFCGEASHGSDGFIGIMDLNKEKVIWIAFFNSSNPFNKVTIEDEQVTAVSTIKNVWKFNINKPTIIEVI
ncbi:hypothetical protein [Mucilaginibacter sp. R-33]|uniref:hypothetical protein n=1 Tax=Mucilaginibacter sp. R-33 TaxID=3416711 RepID=UPI003CE9ADC9